MRRSKLDKPKETDIRRVIINRDIELCSMMIDIQRKLCKIENERRYLDEIEATLKGD